MKTPWHLWLVAALSLLWNAGGAFDYVMIQTRNAAYLDQMSAEQMGYVMSFPVIVSAAWALGVWGGVLGSVLLLMRSRWALHAFVVSLAGMVANLIWGFALSPTPMSGGTMAMAFTGAILVVAVLLVWYARAMLRKGLLG